VSAELVSNTNKLNIDCEVTISIDDFLHVYSGKATASDIMKLCYSGKVHVSGFQVRFLARFAQSFEFSTAKWEAFYKWQKHTKEKKRCFDPNVTYAGDVIPRGIALYIRQGGVNMHKLQRTCLEASLGRIFGTHLLLPYSALLHRGNLIQRHDMSTRAKKLTRTVQCVAGIHPNRWDKNDQKTMQREIEEVMATTHLLISMEEMFPTLSNVSLDHYHVNDGCHSLLKPSYTKFEHPIRKCMIYFKQLSKENERRVDLTDAGMTQLNRMMCLGPALPMVKSNYMPAPQRVFHGLKHMMTSHGSHSTSFSTVLRNIDSAISFELGLPSSNGIIPCPSHLPKVYSKGENVLYNTNREFVKTRSMLKAKMKSLRMGMLVNDFRVPVSAPDNMTLLIDF
jgi:hypothetical protein